MFECVTLRCRKRRIAFFSFCYYILSRFSYCFLVREFSFFTPHSVPYWLIVLLCFVSYFCTFDALNNLLRAYAPGSSNWV